MQTLFSVAAGGALGAVIRWLLATRLNVSAFPWGTWAVNVIGSFLIGWLCISLAGRDVSEALRAGVIVGVLGGFTTYSTFSMEVVMYLEQGDVRTAAVNALSSFLLCILMAFLGMWLARHFY